MSGKRIKPDIGHVVQPITCECCTFIVVAKRGIEVKIMKPGNKQEWIRRDKLRVISEDR